MINIKDFFKISNTHFIGFMKGSLRKLCSFNALFMLTIFTKTIGDTVICPCTPKTIYKLT